ncbi:ammonium transporter Rh type B isoform X2 [Athalia rosae]|uniref:ammonium transporter Rh type B isoform X2 n=2 Tax=Athalia rosae TaxID=37344 RepID=UPI000626C205|nr:ammonium transporter Rh type B isoform X2 [Athalia rosae]XP_012254318.1 ammonium transporter Rh type B isoform X2 [Athalia rosae]XP_012254319.1 ammonium transporter Rh type B isoform X2 [Athalia rosae]XP_012254320.1 ammonium transporter Rh type B isoform X2 [Athalia rosae]XP_020707503.1 ammonium transporter Rh type B isoform X2 [Athalia rosae]
MGKGMYGPCKTTAEVLTLFTLQIIIFVLMGTLMTYGPQANAKMSREYIVQLPNAGDIQVYPMYQDVHVMIWVGFGFLMTFLRKYGQSAVGLTFLVAAILVQVAILCQGVLYLTENSGKAPLSLLSLLSADVAVAAPLISMGALLGKTTYMQLICMGIIELIVYTINKHIGEKYFVAVDAGDSMYVHVFGAYFGLAVSFVFGLRNKPKNHHLEGANYQSDIFAMIGTIFLWLFWPSFNSASLHGDDQQRAIINTLLSISASCVMAFATSAVVSKDNKFNMVHIQNSTLAGGVAVGTAAGMMCEPVGALVIGAIAGVLSVLGYKYLTPLIQKVLKIHDTCGVHNLHGMPGVLAGLFGALMAGLATIEQYDYSLYEIFPARASSSMRTVNEIRAEYPVNPGQDRTASGQAGYQLLTLLVTLLVAIITGIITGYIINLPIFGTVPEEQYFDDAVNWELEEEEHEVKHKEQTNIEQLPMGHI